MEGVNTIMPVATAAEKVLQGALPLLARSGQENGANKEAEQRAQMVEARARRQADAEWRAAQDQADALREKGEKARARARVGAATSGLTLSGTSLLSLENMASQNDSAVDELLGIPPCASTPCSAAPGSRPAPSASRAARSGTGAAARC